MTTGCWDCGEIVVSEQLVCCRSCKNHYCTECIYVCSVEECYKELCLNCLERCSACNLYACKDHYLSCMERTCDNEVCDDCWKQYNTDLGCKECEHMYCNDHIKNHDCKPIPLEYKMEHNLKL